MNIEDTFKLNDLKHQGSIIALRIEGSKNSINQRVENLIKELQIVNINTSILEVYQSEIFGTKLKLWNFFLTQKIVLLE